jgi:glutathionylspermidine synthase
MYQLQKYLNQSYVKNTIDDISVMRLNYNTDNQTCTPNWRVWANHPGCIISSYPKEWLVAEIEPDAILGYDLGDTRSFEPFWKLILGNKAILPLLWNKYPNHKYLLPAFF